MRIAFVLAAAVCVTTALLAQAKVNPTDPQPSCNMCPGTYIPLSELDAYTKKAMAEKLVDQQMRDIDIGKAHVGIGMVYRGKLDKPLPNSVAEHDQVSEVYHIISGIGDARPRAGHRQSAAAAGDAPHRHRIQRPGQQRIGDSKWCRTLNKGGRCRRDSGRNRSLVYKN